MNPVLLDLDFIQIRWYSVLILIACFIVLFLSQNEAQRFGVQREFIFNILFWALIMGVIGARLYYVLFNLETYSKNPIEILKVWNGGFAIHGGLIFALLTIVFYCKKYKVRIVRLLDFLVVPLLLGQAIGRWGNFFNQEAHGVATSVNHLKTLMIPDFIIEGMTIDGVVYTPTFFYESIVCLIAFIVLLFIRRGKYTKVGTMTASYLMIYGILRFFIETSRTDALMVGGFRVAQIVSVIMVIFGLGMIMLISKKGKFEDRYNDPENSLNIRY